MFEIDFLGGYGAGNIGEVHLLPRLRIGYAELNWGSPRPVRREHRPDGRSRPRDSLTHIGAPYFLVSGNMGFRRPGMFGYHLSVTSRTRTAGSTSSAGKSAVRQWADAAAAVSGNSACAGNRPCTERRSARWPSARPVRGRERLRRLRPSGSPRSRRASRVNKGSTSPSSLLATGIASIATAWATSTGRPRTRTASPLDVIGGNAGLKRVLGPLTFAGGGYVGKNLGPLIGAIAGNFFTTAGDVHEYGFWGQSGLNMTKELSALGLRRRLGPEPRRRHRRRLHPPPARVLRPRCSSTATAATPSASSGRTCARLYTAVARRSRRPEGVRSQSARSDRHLLLLSGVRTIVSPQSPGHRPGGRGFLSWAASGRSARRPRQGAPAAHGGLVANPPSSAIRSHRGGRSHRRSLTTVTASPPS